MLATCMNGAAQVDAVLQGWRAHFWSWHPFYLRKGKPLRGNQKETLFVLRVAPPILTHTSFLRKGNHPVARSLVSPQPPLPKGGAVLTRRPRSAGFGAPRQLGEAGGQGPGRGVLVDGGAFASWRGLAVSEGAVFGRQKGN